AGPIRTLAASAVKGLSDIRDLMEEKAPLRRNVTQDEVGDVGLVLASDLSRCVTGEIIHADNGFSIVGVTLWGERLAACASAQCPTGGARQRRGAPPAGRRQERAAPWRVPSVEWNGGRPWLTPAAARFRS